MLTTCLPQFSPLAYVSGGVTGADVVLDSSRWQTEIHWRFTKNRLVAPCELDNTEFDETLGKCQER